MKLLFFDEPAVRKALLPLTYTKPVSELRVGILTVREKWEHMLGIEECGFLTEAYLSTLFPADLASENLCLNGAVLPDRELAEKVRALPEGKGLRQNGRWLAFRLDREQAGTLEELIRKGEGLKVLDIPGEEYLAGVDALTRCWDLFTGNGEALEADLALLGMKQAPESLKERNTVLGKDVFVESGARVEGATINATTGPVYIGKDAEVMEGCLIRGPFALCDHATLKMGAKIYGPTTVGPFSKVGGEVNNSVIQGYSNKAHDGFLGNSVIGEWCNLGADTNNSNLKNDYGEVKMWSYETEQMERTGRQFCGLVMADHAKCGINTMFNTGTVIGVSANIFGGGFPPKFIPSFSWGGAHGLETYHIEKAVAVAEQVCSRRGKTFGEEDQAVFKSILERTRAYRETGG